MPQLSYSFTAINSQPGMAFDAEASARDVVSRIAAQNLGFGVACELNASGLAVPLQDAGTTTTFLPSFVGISMFDPLGVEQQYTFWTVPLLLAGTVSVTNGSASVTFSTAQTLPAGAAIVFTKQNGVVYFLAAAISAGTAGTLTQKYSGVTASGAGSTTTQVGGGSAVSGWLQGQAVPFMRRGRIWVQGDAAGTQTRYGAINVHHSSDGTHAQGVFTFSAASATAGNEIDVAPNVTQWNPDLIGGTTGLTLTDPFGQTFQVYPVEINL